MDDARYLPVGTICSIKKYNKLVMIIGYFSVVYNGNVVMYDYKACDYPEGILLENKIISFNHSDIISILHMGLKNEQFDHFNNILLSQQSDETSKKSSTQTVFKNIKFDENGVVLYDSLVEEINDIDDSSDSPSSMNNSSSTIKNPFYENYIEKETKTSNSSNWPIFRNIKFDKNGVIISAEENNEG